MGNSHSQSVSRFSPSLLNGTHKDQKEGRGRKFSVAKFASPENRVLPVPSNVPQRLRSTDNGNILHNGGTISGRKSNFISVPSPEPEFVQLLQNKKTHHTSQAPSENVSFQTLYGHRKSHSDPDIVRMMMSENDNETDEDDSDTDGRCEIEGNFNKRSIIAVSPSKAKIKSRKKKRAPEPPQSNTLPRTLGRTPSHYKEERPGSSHSPYEYNDTPRRPLPPIPPEEMPPPPPPPPPDYNRGTEDIPLKGVSKNYEKNRRTVDKWKFSKQPPLDFPVEKFPRQRCKSLDRCEEQRLRECVESRKERCNRNNSLRRANHTAEGGSGYRKEGDEKSSGPALKDAIVDAAKKRSERMERGQEYRNSSFKLSMQHPRDIITFKDQGRSEPVPIENTPPYPYNNPPPFNHKNVSDHHNSRYDKYGKDSERSTNEHSNFHNFSRRPPLHKRGSENWKEYRNDFPVRSYERQSHMEHKRYNEEQAEIMLTECNGRQSKWDSITHEPISTMLPDTAVSISSTSEEEMEIDLQLRPTLPRRPVELSRFSPTDVWKSINLDFFKSHQQRSDVSSDDADDIMEEKICRINRPVAPRRLNHDRSGDSGISPDAGSPMLLNESLDVLLMNNNVMSSTPPAPLLAEETGNMWVPQHDLADDSECGTDDSPLENRNNSSKINIPAKLSMPNLMFPSRSLPRTDQRNGIEEVLISDKEKVRSKGRRKKSYKNSEGQHFNSLRNLKKALGLRLKTPVDDSKGLDPNWSLSRSLPNFINNLNVETAAKPETEAPEMYVLDHIRRSNSESKAVYQERLGAKLAAAHSNQNLNSEWRKSFPCQTSEGHVIYLPEYRSSTSQLKSRVISDELHVNTDSELVLKKSNSRKKFSYQSTVRQEEKKKLEEKLAREAEARERKRQQEIEWMNKVEEEFRKQRDKEKVNIRHQLRILNLQEKSDSNEACKSDSNEVTHQVPKHEIAEFADNFTNIKPNVQYGFPEPGEREIPSFKSSKDINDDPCKWQQPTGMKKWLKRQNRDYQCPMRPEPEGGRSSSDDCKQMDGKNRNIRDGIALNGYYKKSRPKCIHGNEIHCAICKNNFLTKSYELTRKESQRISSSEDAKSSPNSLSLEAKKIEARKCTREQVHSKTQNLIENGVKENGTLSHNSNDPRFLRESLEEYELHTRLCRTNSGRTFESHSYYALERRKEDPADFDAIRKTHSERDPKPNLFSTSHFQKELKENVRKKARDFEKRTRKYQSCDYDSDDSGSDAREVRHQRPHTARNQKRKPTGDTREPSFSRNHPHRNGGRVKSQVNGHIPNGRAASYTKIPNNRAILPQQRIPTC